MQDNQDDKRQLAIELFVISFVSLYLELFVIRWLSGGIRFFTVFRTFPLITCFVGLGLGCAAGKDKLFRYTSLSLLLVALVIKMSILTGVMTWMFPSFSMYNWQDLEVVDVGKVIGCVFLVLIMLTGPFALMTCVGSRMGPLFNALPPLPAYSINVAGAIAGSIAFALVSFWGWQPAALLIPAAVPIAYYVWRRRVSVWLGIVPLIAAAVISYWPTESANVKVFWSPYQQLTVSTFRDYFKWDAKPGSDEAAAAPDDPDSVDFVARAALGDLVDRCFSIKTNYYLYQVAINTSDAAVQVASLYEPWATLFRRDARHYNMPYLLKKAPKDLLVVGAGSGNDVAAALRNGAEHVDAVDLDPVIIGIGRHMHPEHPYDSPRVTVICNDARDYFNKCHKKYDMIIIAGLDSQTVSGQSSSMRVDTYVHTRESIAQAASLLKPEGLLLVTFYDRVEWIGQRLFCTIKSAVGYDPVVVHDSSREMQNFWETFIVGPPVKDGTFTLPPNYFPFVQRKLAVTDCGHIVTDDWPYLYVMPVLIDWPYWLVMLSVLTLSWLGARRILFVKNAKTHWQMFFLGAAFLLLELKSVAQLALVYGATWLTSSIVIDGILVMILLANFIAMRMGERLFSHQGKLYAILACLMTLSYFTPTDFFLSHSGMPSWLAQFLVTLLSLLPLFAASLIFACAFGRVKEPGRALAYNLLGAVIGGLMEYFANYTGIRSLILLAGVLYAMSFLALKRERGDELS